MFIFSNNQNRLKEAKRVLENFEMKDLGKVQNCLGMCIRKDKQNNKIYLNQTKCIETILEKFGIDKCNPISIPMDRYVKLTKDMESKNKVRRD